MNLPVKSLVWSVLGMTFIPYKTYETACNTIALRVSKSHCTKDEMLASTTAHRPVGKEYMIPTQTNKQRYIPQHPSNQPFVNPMELRIRNCSSPQERIHKPGATSAF